MGRPRRDEGPEGAPPSERERIRWERALGAALRGPAVARSARSRQLLAYLVGETLAGRRHRITGITIAQDVLGRDASFDSESDAIVRVQMRRLRVQLAEDQVAGAPGDAPWIVVPKGAYRPELTHAPAKRTAPRPAAGRAPEGPAPGPAPQLAPGLAEPARPWGSAPPEREGEPPGDTAGPGDRRRGPRRLLLAALAPLGAAALWLASDDAAILLAERSGRVSVSTDFPAAADRPTVAVPPIGILASHPRDDAFRRGLQVRVASDLQRFGTVRAPPLDGPPPERDAAPVRHLVGRSPLAVGLEALGFLSGAGTGRAAAAGGPEGYHAPLARLPEAASGRILGEHGSLAGLEDRLAALGIAVTGPAADPG